MTEPKRLTAEEWIDSLDVDTFLDTMRRIGFTTDIGHVADHTIESATYWSAVRVALNAASGMEVFVCDECDGTGVGANHGTCWQCGGQLGPCKCSRHKWDPHAFDINHTMYMNDLPPLNKKNVCDCAKCDPNANHMIVCSECGNKRCPKATDHDLACTHSNKPGQKGSSWEDYQIPTEKENE